MQEILNKNYDDVILRAYPTVETHREVVYIPIDDQISWGEDTRWGMYDRDGNLVQSAAYYRGPGKKLLGQSEHQDISDLKFERAPPGKYIYGGLMIDHFGHFLFSAFSRFWLGSFEDLSKYKIVCHGHGTPDGWFSHIYIRDIFEHLGLTMQNFIVLKRPTIFSEIVIPSPSFEEHNFAHRAFSQWGNNAGDWITRSHARPLTSQPVWISKTKLESGVQRCANEIELEEILITAGFEIVHPQHMHIIEQIFLFRSHRYITGFIGSAFHASILAPPSSRIIGLSIGDVVNNNYTLIDKVNDNISRYFTVEGDFQSPQSEMYMSEFWMKNPKAVADDLISLVEL